jgi:hypothetical protein
MPEADLAFVHAVQQRDKPALGKLLDDDFGWIRADGRVESRADVLRDVPAAVIPAERAAELMTYTYGAIGDVQSNVARWHVLRVWVRRGGAWKIIVYQEVESLAAPLGFTVSAGQDCENPCKEIPFQANNDTEREVVAAYSRLETAAMAHNSAVFATLVGDEFVAASSNSTKTSNKRGRMDDFDHAKNSGVAPTPLTSARMFDFGAAVLMTSLHTPARGKPLRVTRIWVKRGGHWVETISYQTSINILN